MTSNDAWWAFLNAMFVGINLALAVYWASIGLGYGAIAQTICGGACFWSYWELIRRI